MMRQVVFILLLMAARTDAGVSEKRITLPITRYEFAVTANLDRAAEKLRDFVIRPGEEFSLNKILGPRKAATGYYKAPVFGGSGVGVLEFGGGLCMVSSVLYNLFLLSGLEITERHPHQRVVLYTDPGFDATIDYGNKDLRARNNFAFPLAIRLNRHGKFLTAEIYAPKGQALPPAIALERDVAADYIPGVHASGFRVRTLRVFAATATQPLKKQVMSEDTFLPIDHMAESGGIR